MTDSKIVKPTSQQVNVTPTKLILVSTDLLETPKRKTEAYVKIKSESSSIFILFCVDFLFLTETVAIYVQGKEAFFTYKKNTVPRKYTIPYPLQGGGGGLPLYQQYIV